MPTITYTETLTTVSCTCGLNYAIPDSLNDQLLNHRGPGGRSVYCPVGHKWYYTGKTEAEKLQERLEAAQRSERFWRDQADAAERSKTAIKGQLTKERNRAAAALCPVPGCKRQVVQMKRHIASKHPDWHPEHEDAPAG